MEMLKEAHAKDVNKETREIANVISKFFRNRKMLPSQEGTALTFSSIIHNTIGKCCVHLVDMKVLRCLCILFYIFVCLFGNIITAIYLYKHYHKSQILPNHVISNEIDTVTSTPLQNSSEDWANSTNIIDDWFIDLDNDVEEKLQPSPKNESTNVSLQV